MAVIDVSFRYKKGTGTHMKDTETGKEWTIDPDKPLVEKSKRKPAPRKPRKKPGVKKDAKN